MSNNLRLWDKFKDPDQTLSDKAIKPVPGGAGLTAIDPFTVYLMATREWGPEGLAYKEGNVDPGAVPVYPCWGFEEVVSEVNGNEHSTTVRFWYPDDGRMKYVLGKGCTELVKGKYPNKDISKQSFTDARTNAMSKVGFGANVYLGKYNDSQYAADVRQRQVAEAESNAPDIVAVQQAFAQVAADLAAGGDPDECMAAFVAVGSGPFKALSKAKQGHVSGAAKALKQAIAEAKARAAGMDAALGAE